MMTSNASIAFQTPPSAEAPKTAEDRSTTFRAVEGGNQMQSGERLLVEAYAAIWIVLFGLILLGWRRQKRIDARVASLEAAIANARAAEPVKRAGGA